MPENCCLRSKWPHGFGSSDGAAAFEHGLRKANDSGGGPINGGSHDIEGWFPVCSDSHGAENARVPYTSVTGTTSGDTRVRTLDAGTSAWITWDSQAGKGLKFQGEGSFTGGSAEVYTNPSSGATGKLCDARALQIWDLNFHAYHNKSGNRNFSVWIFFLNSSHNYVGSTFSTPNFATAMEWSGESEGGTRAYLHPSSGEYGHTSGYNGMPQSLGDDGGRNRSLPFYDNGKAGYNFKFVPLDDTHSDYKFYQIVFKVPDNSDIRGLGFRMDLDSADMSVQIDEICLRPLNVSLRDCNGGSGTDISLDALINA